MNIRIVRRSNLYFNKYKYKTVTYIPGASLAKKSKNLNEFFNTLEWKKRYSSFYHDLLPDQETIDRLITFLTSEKDYAVRTEWNSVSFFFNDISLLQDINAISSIGLVESVEEYEHGSVELVNPKFKFRTYVKPSSSVDTNNKVFNLFTDFVKYNKNLTSPARFSKSINDLLESGLDNRASRQFYSWWRGGHIDYNDEQMLTILHLYLSPIISQTVKLVKKTKS
jgi:hypothetical protein